MYEKIEERIAVAGVYRGAKFFPKRFSWRNRIFEVDNITFVVDFKDGATKKRRYSVTSGLNAYRLLFDRLQEYWQLEEIWVD